MEMLFGWLWEWVDRAYVGGRTTSISDEEMVARVREHLPELVR